MTSIVLACLWIVTAQIIAFLPTRDRHWRAAYGLIAVGLPVLGYLWWENGALWALAGLAAGLSILRWPVIYAWRRVRRLAGGE